MKSVLDHGVVMVTAGCCVFTCLRAAQPWDAGESSAAGLGSWALPWFASLRQAHGTAFGLRGDARHGCAVAEEPEPCPAWLEGVPLPNFPAACCESRSSVGRITGSSTGAGL